MRIDLDNCRDPDLLVVEVRRLRAVIAASKPTLTDAEREAVEMAADLIDNKTCGDSSTLRGLLERL